MVENLSSQTSDYKRPIFLSIILICLGVVLMNTISTPSVGIVFIAVGVFFFIVGISRKKAENKE